MQLCLIRHCPPSLTEATAAGQSPPSSPDCAFLEGEKSVGGSHPRVWLGKGWGFWINPFPSQLCAVGRL